MGIDICGVFDGGLMKKEVSSKKMFIRNVVIGGILIAMSIAIWFLPVEFSSRQSVSAEFSAVDKICELATLKCYYHNVLEDEKQPDGLFKYGLFQYGYKKFWMEYDGIVKVGVDASDVVVKPIDENRVVKIYIPKATILDIDVDEESMSELIAETGVLTTITTDDQAKAYSMAQENMKKCAEADTSVLNEAYMNAKKLLEQYIINVGEQIEQKLIVEWLENPND